MAVNSGQRPDYKQRMAQKKRSGMIKLFLYAVVIGAGVGLAYVKRAELKSMYESFTASKPAAPAPAPKEKPTETVKAPEVKAPVVEKKTVEVPVPPKPPEKVGRAPIDAAGSAAAMALIAKSKALFEEFKFANAAKMLEASLTMSAGQGGEELKAWHAKAVQFDNATKHINVADFAQASNAVLVTTVDGTEWRGLKTRETDEQLFLQAVSENPASEGKQTFPISKSEIKSTAPLSIAERQADFAALLKGLEQSITITHPSDFYDVVYLSKRLGMGKEAVAYLNRAYDGENGRTGDPNIGDTFRNLLLRRTLGRASLLMAAGRRTQVDLELQKLQRALVGFGPAEEEIAGFRSQVMNKVQADFKPSIAISEKKQEFSRPKSAEKAKAPSRDDEIEVSVSGGDISGNGAAGPLVQKANAKFKEGAALLGKYKLGGNKGDNNGTLLGARALLIEAIDLYDQALKVDGGNKAVRDRQTSAGMMVYTCNKNLIL